MSKKNSAGTGSFYRRPNGTWQLAIMDGYKTDGKRNRVCFYGRTQKEAREKANKYFKDKADGLQVNEKIKFSDFADYWYEHHKTRVSETTAEGYKYTLKKVKEAFGDRYINSIKPYDIENALECLQDKGVADSSVRKVRGMMYQIFNKAEANDLIRKNPVRFAENIRARNKSLEKEAYTESEVKLLMNNLPDNRIGSSIRLLLCTGMRSQELLALEPRYIAKDGSYIYIRQAVVLVKGTVKIGPPKSDDSYRDIPIPEEYRYCAIALRSTSKKFIWEVGKPGVPCNPTYFRDKYREAIESVEGVRLLTPHSCRHTYVSQLQALGVDIPTIQSLCGHAEVDMTQHYLHVQENIRLAAVERFGQKFSRESEPDDACNIMQLTGSSTEQVNKDDYDISIPASFPYGKNNNIIKFPKSN